MESSTTLRYTSPVTPEIFPDRALSFFPPGYSPRPEQRNAIVRIQKEFDSGKKIVAFQGPTGMGKTLIAQTFALKTLSEGGRAHYLTIQKNLQDQLVKQFPDVVALKGRANYACNHKDAAPKTDASKGVCRDKNRGILMDCVHNPMDDPLILFHAANFQVSPSCQICPYWHQGQLTADASISAFTFSSFLFQRRLGRFEPRKLMIIDECHNIESELMKFVTLELTEFALTPLGIEIDEEIFSSDDLLDWINRKQIHEKLLALLGDSAFKVDIQIADGLSLEQSEALQSLLTKIEYFKKLLNLTQWVVETRSERNRRGVLRPKIVCRPMFVQRFAKDLLFSNGEQVLCMSATILDFEIWRRNLGLTKDEVAYVEGPCPFPPKNRPLHVLYAGNMGQKYFEKGEEPTRPKLMGTILWILNFHAGQRGIIHCHSKKLSNAILEDVKSTRFLRPEDFPKEDKQLLLEAHGKRKDSVILAPGMHEGVDLANDLSRFQIIAKVPWADKSDKLISERMLKDDLYYPWLCALKLVQSYGRSVRNQDDWAHTYILDGNFAMVLSKHRRILPDWFLEALHFGRPQNPLKPS